MYPPLVKQILEMLGLEEYPRQFLLYYAALVLILVIGILTAPWGLLLVALSILSLLGLKEVPASPPHVAIPTVWGVRIAAKFEEGLKLAAPIFPFLLDFILINVERRNEDFKFENIRCKLKEDDPDVDEKDAKSGGSVLIKVSITWRPDYRSRKAADRLISFLNAGQDGSSESGSGVRTIMRDMLAEDLRHVGRKRSWETMVFGQDKLSAVLITKMTGHRIQKAERDADDKPILKNNGKLLFPRKKVYVDDVDKAHEKEIEHFLHSALTNGCSDIWDLGISISRLNVTEVEPEGALKEDAELAAREVQQLQAEGRDVDTEIALAEKYVAAAKANGEEEMTMSEGLRLARINRKRAGENHIFINPGKKRGDGDADPDIGDKILAANIVASQAGGGSE